MSHVGGTTPAAAARSGLRLGLFHEQHGDAVAYRITSAAPGAHKLVTVLAQIGVIDGTREDAEQSAIDRHGHSSSSVAQDSDIPA